jgi:dTDP-4-dehydrorhamnose reductase
MTNESSAKSATDALPLRGFLKPNRAPVAILGKSSILAMALARVLARCDVPLIALSRQECDLTKRDDLASLLSSVEPSCIVNCAAMTNLDDCDRQPQLCNEINGHAVGRLASLCRAHDTPLIHISCASIFHGRYKNVHEVDDKPRPASQHGRSKALGELLLRRYAPQRWLLVRTSWLFGDLNRDLVGQLLSQVGGDKPIFAADDQIGSPTFSSDLASAILLLLVAGATGIWHLSNRGIATSYTFAKAVFETWQRPAVVWPCRTQQKLEDAPPTFAGVSSALDCSTTYQRLGLRMRRWESSLAAYNSRSKLLPRN